MEHPFSFLSEMKERVSKLTCIPYAPILLDNKASPHIENQCHAYVMGTRTGIQN